MMIALLIVVVIGFQEVGGLWRALEVAQQGGRIQLE